MPKKKPSWIKDHEVRKKVPKGRKLPNKFDAFIAAQPELPIEWDDLESLGLKPEGLQEALPFMRTHTGGKVAFWYHAADPAVVYFGDEGQLDVLALNFDEFLKGAVLGKSGVHDLDDSEPRLRVPGVQGKPSKAGLAALQKKFDAWWKQNKAMLEPKTDSEALRQKLHAAGAQMFADGKSKVWRPGSDWWSLKFRIERIAGKLSVGIFERGKATPVPRKYNFLPLVEELLTLVKNKQKAAYELSISSYGGVSVDSDRELLLLSVEQAAKSAKIFAEGAQRKK